MADAETYEIRPAHPPPPLHSPERLRLPPGERIFRHPGHAGARNVVWRGGKWRDGIEPRWGNDCPLVVGIAQQIPQRQRGYFHAHAKPFSRDYFHFGGRIRRSARTGRPTCLPRLRG